MKRIKIIINESIDKFLEDEEKVNAINSSIIRMGRMRLQKVAEKEDIDSLITSLRIEKDILSFAAESYASINETEIFDEIANCIEQYDIIENELLALKG